MAYEINTKEGKRIIYTGDIRFHGHSHERALSISFLKNINPNPDALITEGTRINDPSNFSELDVYRKALKTIISDCKRDTKLIIASFPWKSEKYYIVRTAKR